MEKKLELCNYLDTIKEKLTSQEYKTTLDILHL